MNELREQFAAIEDDDAFVDASLKLVSFMQLERRELKRRGMGLGELWSVNATQILRQPFLLSTGGVT